MFELIAKCIDHPLGRIVLGLTAIVITSLFGSASVALIATLTHDWSIVALLGLAGLLGIIGGWARLLANAAALSRSRPLRWFVVGALGAGTLAAGTLLLGSVVGLSAWNPVSTFLLVLGVLLIAGTVVAFRHQGPNNSFKPKPLRGSA